MTRSAHDTGGVQSVHSAADEDWLAEAVHAAASLTDDRVAAPGNRWPISTRPAIRPGPSHADFGLHDHHVPELCLAIRGRAGMTIGSVTHPFDPPTLALLPSGVMHSETCRRRTWSYAILWLNFGAGDSVFALVSTYSASQSWRIPLRAIGRSDAASDLAGLTESADPGAFRIIRALLVKVLADLHCDALQSDHSRADVSSQPTVLEHVRAYLDAHYDQPLDLRQVASLARLSPNYLNTQFRKWLGKGIHAYLTERRMNEARRLLHHPDRAVKDVAQAVGYADPLYFSKAFRKHFGQAPSDARQTHGERLE